MVHLRRALTDAAGPGGEERPAAFPPSAPPIRLLNLALVVAIAVSATACARLAVPAGLKPAHVEPLYFGRNIGDTATVSDSAWQDLRLVTAAWASF
jgi:hypothetical protein